MCEELKLGVKSFLWYGVLGIVAFFLMYAVLSRFMSDVLFFMLYVLIGFGGLVFVIEHMKKEFRGGLDGSMKARREKNGIIRSYNDG